MLNPIRSKIIDFIIESGRFCDKEIKGRHETCTFSNMFYKKGKLSILVAKEKIYTISVDLVINGNKVKSVKGEGTFNEAYKDIIEGLQEVLNVVNNR